MYDGSIKIDTKIDTNGFSSGIEKLKAIANKGVSYLTTSFTAVSTAIAAGGTAAVKVGSEFEAAMSRVSAISGATGADLETLKNQAVDLGASTAFSAKEAAQGMENLASAGFSVNEITKAMPGMLDLAASSGEDLATSADIAASTLRGFGLEASQASHVADVLAKNAADTNAAVADTGEAMKYIAPLAKAAGISFEETAAAIGIMADNGIKGGQAGTTLRGALSRLSKPTDDMLGVMEKLNLEFYDSEGNMKSLSDQMSMLKEATVDMTDEERNRAVVTLYGQEALSGMLALMQSEDGRLESLTKSYQSCDGAAAEMAKTMQDNLQSKVEELGGSLETLGIKIYEDLSEPLKSAADEGIEYVNKLTNAFENGGFEGLIEEAGNIFSELAVKAAEASPAMIEAAIGFIEAFTSGIINHSDELITAAKKIVNTITDNLVKLLPAELQKPIKECINTIKKSFNDGGLRSAINTVKNIITNLGKVITNVAKVVLPPLSKALDFAAGSLDELIPLVTAAYTAYKAWSIISAVTALIKANTAAVTAETLARAASTGAITLNQIAIGTLTGQISLATAAQYAWNLAMSLNPIGVVVTAVAALAAGIVAMTLCMQDNKTTAEELAEINNNLGESYGEIGEGIANFLDGVDNADSILDGFNDSIILSNEKQQELASEMDSVQSEITEIAKLASEERRKLTEDEILRLDELFTKMHELAEQELAIKRAYQEVVTVSAKDLSNNFEGSLAEYEAKSQSIAKTAEETRAAVISKAEEQYYEEIALLNYRFEKAKEISQEEYDNLCTEASKRKEEAIVLANEEAAETLEVLQNGYYDRAEVLQEYTEKLTELNTSEEEETRKHQETLKELEREYNSKLAEYRKQGYDDVEFDCAQRNALLLKEQLEYEEHTRHQEETKRIKNEQQKILDDKNYQNQLKGFIALTALYETYSGKTTEKSQKIVNGFFKPMESMPDETKEKFEESLQGAINGLGNKEHSLYQKAATVAGTFINKFRSMFDIHSPSRVFKKMFKQNMEGAEIGTADEARNLYKQADEVSSTFTKRMQAGVSADGLVAQMREAVSIGRNMIASKLTANMIYDVNLHNADNNKKFVLKGDLNAKIGIDGREFAVATAPYISEEIAWEDK